MEGLTKSYKDVEVLKGIDLKVERGTMLALLGPNGAGKTTIVRILSTLLKYDSGKVTVHGYDVKDQAHEVRQNIGLTSQYAALDEFLTGMDNLVMMGRLFHLSKEDANKRAHELLEQFDLVDAANRPVKTYSGGMRRRLDLAVSLIPTPPVIFLDEPTTGLDPRSRLAMWNVIKKLVEADVTILLTTQYLEEADQLADKIAVIDNGKVIAEGTSDELKSKVGNERLELVIKDSENFARAVSVLANYKFIKNDEERTINITIDSGVQEIAKILSLIEQNSVQIESLSLHKPTLDDVFLQLTGHEAEDKKVEDK
ncbi:TPA: daunorubicin/doxorubicin resistance ABC transporter ATP-binding protein DrrA [Patescibacteria group bacterium]|nr:daunorubicin/doxorubicin resistance ABC transporter ATP-binding protein DrrA [Patescibacteria group bacterium]